MRVLAIVLLATILGGSGCSRDSGNEPDPGGTDATVRYVNVEGGCWVLVTGAGKTFEPLALPPGYHQDGMEVRFAYHPRPDAGSFCMVGGELVDITAISPR